MRYTKESKGCPMNQNCIILISKTFLAGGSQASESALLGDKSLKWILAPTLFFKFLGIQKKTILEIK